MQKNNHQVQYISVFLGRFVNKYRYICSAGGAVEDIDDDRRIGNDQPTPERLCEVAVEEAAKRGILNDLYEEIGGDAAATRQRIFEAAVQNVTRFALPSGQPARLTCPLAFDAGYAYGVENSAQPVAKHVTDAQILEVQRDGLMRRSAHLLMFLSKS